MPSPLRRRLPSLPLIFRRAALQAAALQVPAPWRKRLPPRPSTVPPARSFPRCLPPRPNMVRSGRLDLSRLTPPPMPAPEPISPASQDSLPTQDLEKSNGQPQELPKENGLITQHIHEHENHAHHYVWAQTTASGLREAICACGHGLQVHPSVHGIVEGKITTL